MFVDISYLGDVCVSFSSFHFKTLRLDLFGVFASQRNVGQYRRKMCARHLNSISWSSLLRLLLSTVVVAVVGIVLSTMIGVFSCFVLYLIIALAITNETNITSFSLFLYLSN